MTSSSRRPLFSVVIPTFNRRDKVVKAVRSVIEQTFDDFEILVVDQGSDGTDIALEEEFGDRVRYMRGAAPSAAAARNLAIERATGEWIAFLDSDDRWYPTKLERFAKAVEAHPQIGLLYSPINLVDENGRYILTSAIRTRENAYPAILWGDFVFTSTAVVKKECLVRSGLFDTTIPSGCEDWDLFIRVTRHCRALLINEPLTAYELSSSESLTSDYVTWVASLEKVIAKSLAADPTLSRTDVARAYAGGHYAKGKIYLGVRHELQALEHFKSAFRLDRRLWRASIYIVLLSWPALQRVIPRRIRTQMRFRDDAAH